MRFTLAQLIWLICGAGATLACYSRGSYLLGPSTGLAFGLIGSATSFLLYRTMRLDHGLIMPILGSVFGLVVFAVLTTPIVFSPNAGYSLEKYHMESLARQQLKTILRDARFSDVKFKCEFRKCILVSISGKIAKESDLADLRDLIRQTSTTRSKSLLEWSVECGDSGRLLEGSD